MICEQCGNDLSIVRSHIVVEGDTSPLEKTKVFRVLEFSCRNPQCAFFGKTAQERILLNDEQNSSPSENE